MHKVLGKSVATGETRLVGEHKSLGHAHQQAEQLRKFWGDLWTIWVESPQAS